MSAMPTPIVQDLIAEFTDAFVAGNGFVRPVRTPGYSSRPYCPVGEVIADDVSFSARSPFRDILVLLHEMYAQKHPLAVSVIQRIAAAHAERHADLIEIDEDAERDHFAEMQASDDRCGVPL